VSTIQTAFQTVGYKPLPERKSQHNKSNNHFSAFESLVDHLIVKTLIGPRNILFQRAGSHVKARYHGEKTFVIGADKREATSRLKTWAGRS
jgi:hypothetical protein